jgi:hypothetical protein
MSGTTRSGASSCNRHGRAFALQHGPLLQRQDYRDGVSGGVAWNQGQLLGEVDISRMCRMHHARICRPHTILIRNHDRTTRGRTSRMGRVVLLRTPKQVRPGALHSLCAVIGSPGCRHTGATMPVRVLQGAASR